MATLHIRNIPDDVHAALRVRAAKAGRSMEAEARELLVQACLPRKPDVSSDDLMNWVDETYGDRKPRDVVDALIKERRHEAANE